MYFLLIFRCVAVCTVQVWFTYLKSYEEVSVTLEFFHELLILQKKSDSFISQILLQLSVLFR